MRPRLTPTRLAEKASTDRAALDALLDECRVAHIGLAVDHHPLVVPTALARDGDSVLVHGSTGSAWMRAAAAGADICLTVTALDGLVVARSAFESSMHYRSAVLFGRLAVVPHEERGRALDLLTEAMLPGRVAEIRRPTDRELAATLVLVLPIQTWSLKISSAWPDDPADDVAGDAWAGVVPLSSRWGAPAATPDLRSGIPVPASVGGLGAPTGQLR